MPFKANQYRQHRIPRQRHRATNWSEYDAALRQRGSLTVWFTEEAVAAWAAEPRTTRGGRPSYSDLAIATALTLRAVFGLALRQTEGLIGSILRLLGLDLAVPDHSTLSRRAEALDVPLPRSSSGSGPVHLLVDSTGLRLCGPGEWLVEKHGGRPRRSWRKLHIGTDADTGRIVASALTTNDADDGSQVGPLLDKIDGPVASHRGRRVRPRRRLRRSRRAAPGCDRHRAAALRRGAERHAYHGADAARPAHRGHGRARPHGLAEGVGLQLACLGRDGLITANSIESVFATVRHRTVRTKGALSQDTARLMVFKLVMAAAKSWRRLNGEHQLPKVIRGVTFRDGVEVADTPAQTAA